MGDWLADETGEWEVIRRAYSSSAGKLASARVRRVGQGEVSEIRTRCAYERISVERGS